MRRKRTISCINFYCDTMCRNLSLKIVNDLKTHERSIILIYKFFVFCKESSTDVILKEIRKAKMPLVSNWVNDKISEWVTDCVTEGQTRSWRSFISKKKSSWFRMILCGSSVSWIKIFKVFLEICQKTNTRKSNNPFKQKSNPFSSSFFWFIYFTLDISILSAHQLVLIVKQSVKQYIYLIVFKLFVPHSLRGGTVICIMAEDCC